MSEQWGPWIEHDGKGCPCLGQWVKAVFHNGNVWEGIAGSSQGGGKSWDWSSGSPYSRLIRYRIRKPRALQDLIKLVEELPEGVEA